MLCPSCGTENPAGSRFCKECAAALGPTCHACGATQPPGSKFCGQCGASIAPTVSGPPPVVDAAAALCSLMPDALKQKVHAAANQITGERREVTVLILDVTNFTAASNRLDSEELYLIINEAMQALAQIVFKYEGAIDKFTGDGLVALFGAPVAHENDPERAVRAGLEMLGVLEPLRKRTLQAYAFDLQVRIGIHTGLVIAGNVGSDLHMEYTIIGDTVTLAASLEAAAEPGSILVSSATYQRTHPLFEYAPVQVAAKGSRHEDVPALQAYRPLALRREPGRVRGLVNLQAPMIGRGAALRTLMTAFGTLLAEPRGRVVVISGDAGLGKSRLVLEFRRRIQDAPVQIFEGSCLAYARSTPFWIVGSLLRDMIGVAETDPQALQRDRLRAFLQAHGLPVEEHLPYLYIVLGIEQTSPYMIQRLATMDPTILQRQIYVVLLQVLRAQCQQRTTVLILEDIHWIDSASRQFILEFLENLADLPVLLLLVTRAYERQSVVQPILARLEGRPFWEADIQLTALAPQEQAELIEQLLRQARLYTPELAEALAARAEGNPFYVEELVRMLLDRRVACVAQDDTPGSTPSYDPEELLQEVPAALNGLILARFDNLDLSLRRHLQRAAVIGRSFPARLLQAMTQEPLADIIQALDTLTERQFLVQEPFGRVPNALVRHSRNGLGLDTQATNESAHSGNVHRSFEAESGYTFRHALIQEAIYSTLLHRDRRALHEQVAHLLENQAFLGPEERTEALAYHYSHTAEPRRAIPHLLAAAENAAHRSGYENAIQFYRRALALLDAAPQGYDEVFCRVHIGLGQALKLAGSLQEAQTLLVQAHAHLAAQADGAPDVLTLRLEALRELADVAQREGEFESSRDYLKEALTLARPLRGQPLWYTLVERMAWVQYRLGNLEEAAQLARTTIQEMEAAERADPFTLASLYNTLGGAAWQEGNLNEAVSYVEGSLGMYEREGYAWGVSVACANLGVLHWTMGNWPAATHWYERAVRIQGENGFLFERATALRNLGYLYMSQGELERAEETFRSALELCTRQNHAFGILSTHLALATLAAEQERHAQMDVHLEAIQAHLESADQESLILLGLAQAQRLASKGAWAEAFHLAQQSLEEAQASGLQAEVLEANYILGVLHRQRGNLDEAQHHLLTTTQLARARNVPVREATALRELALLYQAQAEKDPPNGVLWLQRARTAAEDALLHFEKLGAQRYTEQIQALLAQLETLIRRAAQPGRDQPAPLRLSPEDIPDGRRGLVTILWAVFDTVSSGDPEEDFVQLQEFFARVMGVVQQHHGRLLRGEQHLTVVFGAPLTFEDDALRAVSCAQALVQSFPPGAGLVSLRVGVSTGEAVTGFVEGGEAPQFVVAGPSVLEAEAIAQQAPPGKVWVAPQVAALTNRACIFRRAPQDRQNSASSGPEDAAEGLFELVDISRGETSLRGLPGMHAHLIGRQDALALLCRQAQAVAQEEKGVFVWLEGEGGIGKSRLMQEFTGQLPQEKFIVAWGRCSPHSSQQAFSMVRSLLMDLLGVQVGDSPESRATALQELIRAWLPDQEELRPYLALLCGAALTPEEEERVRDLEPESLRQQIFVAMRSLLAAQARTRPLLVALDDLQWIDPMSAHLLYFLSYMAPTTPIFFLCALRPGEDAPGQQALAQIRTDHPHLSTTVRLEGLSARESEALLRALLQEGEPSPQLRDFILTRSEGNPYYLEEFLRLLLEQGYIRREGQVWTPQGDASLQELPLPATLEMLIRARVDALPGPAQAVLQLAAVLSRPFTASLLAELAPHIQQMEEALQELARRNLLISVDASMDGPGEPPTTPAQNGRTLARTWRISHHLVQKVVYESLLKIRRQALHLQVADTLAARWQGQEEQHAEELAFHFVRAGAAKQALPYLLRAGEQAASRYANEEALAFLAQAQALIADSEAMAPPSMRWRAVVGLADVHLRTGRIREAKQLLEANLELVAEPELRPDQKASLHRRLGMANLNLSQPEAAYDHFRQGLVILEEPEDEAGQSEAARILHGLTYMHFRRGQLERALETAALARHYAQQAQDRSVLATVENLTGGIAHRMGDYSAAIAHTTKAMDIRQELGDSWDVASTLGNLGVLAATAGDWDEARGYFERSLTIRQTLGDVEGVALIHHNLGFLRRLQGDLDTAERHFVASLEQAQAMGMVYHMANAFLGVAQVRLLQDDVESAQQFLDQTVALARQADARDILADIQRVQAEMHLKREEWPQAVAAAQLAIKAAAAIHSTSLELHAWQTLGACLLAQGRLTEAETALLQAKKLIADAPNDFEAGRVAFQLGKLRMIQARPEEAEQELEYARSVFTRLGAQYEQNALESYIREEFQMTNICN
ncbi:MAG: hypothetical protein D6790_06260 [Caldilineae bacterium]|nr:MAG: hypothetical protein D6790_06260 [Caldilineae bacterium]